MAMWFWYVDVSNLRILIFGRESHANWANNMLEVFADGTFIISPPLFQQVYAILSRLSFLTLIILKNK